MLGNERLGGTVNLVFSRSVKVTGGNGAVLFGQRREEGIREFVLLDEFLGDNPEDLSPDLTDGMYTPVTWLVEGFVRRGVYVDVLEMHVRCEPDAA